MPCPEKSDLDAVLPAAVADERVKTVMILIQKEGYSRTGVQKAAGSVYLSVSRLSHLFKQETGLSILEYAKVLQLRRAKHLIEQTQARIKEIAALVGYKDSKRLIRDFKAAFGSTPRQYRKQLGPAAPPGSAGGDAVSPASSIPTEQREIADRPASEARQDSDFGWRWRNQPTNSE